MNQIKKNAKIPWLFEAVVFLPVWGLTRKWQKIFITLNHVITESLASSIMTLKAVL